MSIFHTSLPAAAFIQMEEIDFTQHPTMGEQQHEHVGLYWIDRKIYIAKDNPDYKLFNPDEGDDDTFQRKLSSLFCLVYDEVEENKYILIGRYSGSAYLAEHTIPAIEDIIEKEWDYYINHYKRSFYPETDRITVVMGSDFDLYNRNKSIAALVDRYRPDNKMHCRVEVMYISDNSTFDTGHESIIVTKVIKLTYMKLASMDDFIYHITAVQDVDVRDAAIDNAINDIEHFLIPYSEFVREGDSPKSDVKH